MLTSLLFLAHDQCNLGCISFVSGKSEVSSVIYKVGESMQELIKLWKEYESPQADKDAVTSPNGPTLEIRIPAEHVTATNRQVRSICCVSISLGYVMFPIGELCHLPLFPRQLVLQPKTLMCVINHMPLALWQYSC